MKVQSFKKSLLWFGFYDKNLEGQLNIPPSPGIELKRHTFSIKHYLHKSYPHKRFILAYIRITKLLKKNNFEKFIEELAFVELSTQVKLLKV